MSLLFLSKIRKTVLIGSVLALLWVACGDEADKRVPDVSGIPVNLTLRRFDRDLFALDTNQLEAGLIGLARQYPQMLPLFTEQIIRNQSNPQETPLQAVGNFLRAPGVRHLYDTVQSAYGDLRWLERELEQMFRFYKYYLPTRPQPEVVTIISEFATDAFTAGDSLCGIGLDMFLGENYAAYFANPNTEPAYIRRQFQQPYITVRLAKALAQQIAGMPPGERLLDQMLHNGKILYIVDCLLPEVSDSLKMGYTREQMEGCYANEQAVWARLLEQNLLYSTDARKLRKLVSPSPNAPVVFQEAPGEIGNWIGWQIAKAYVQRHPQATIEDLLNFRDAQKFLEQSKYKPKRE